MKKYNRKINLVKIEKGLKKMFTRYKFSILSYAQEGEDLILHRFFGNKKKGFYVDVGAHHPFRYSNTHFFYKRGWHGINIEPMPEAKKIFACYRKRDINVQKGISQKKEALTYFEFKSNEYNTFNPENAEEYKKIGVQFLRSQLIETVPLSDILDEHVPPGTIIDFLSIDTEGFEMQVLNSNNWNKYEPVFIILESHEIRIEPHLTSDIHRFMKNKNYELVSKSFYSYIYRKVQP